MASSGRLYEEVVAVTYEYLGPAADRFITRQIRNHLKKEPENLKQKDLNKLIDWLSISMSLITKDEGLVIKYITTLEKMAKTKQRGGKANARRQTA